MGLPQSCGLQLTGTMEAMIPAGRSKYGTDGTDGGGGGRGGGGCQLGS